MVTTATLSVEVNARGARTASNDLSLLARQSNRAERAVDAVSSRLERMTKLLALGGLASFAKHIINMADTMQSLNSQVKQVTNGIAEYTHAQRALFEISQSTHASLEATTQTFVSTKRALADLGVTTNQTLKFTETLNKAMAVGGVNAESQKSALLQLSQALGSGVLQGDEFRSIAENAPIILDVVAEYMGKTRAEVKKLASDGKVTSKVLFEAISGASGKISAKFDEMPMTFGQAMQQMENAWLKFTDGLNSSGITSGLAQAVSFLAQHFEQLGLVIGLVALGQLGKFTQSTLSSMRATQQQAVTVLQAAQTASTQATAEVNLARANMQVLASQLRLAQSEQTRLTLRNQMAAQSARITQLANAEAVATANLAKAQQAASISGRAASLASGALNGVMGLLGGPAGAAMMAAGALFYFWQKGQEAKEAALDASRANELLQQSYQGLTAVTIQDKISKEIAAYKELEETLQKLATEMHIKKYYGATKEALAEATNNYELAKQNFETTTKAMQKHFVEFTTTMLSEGKNVATIKERFEALGVSTEQVNSILADNAVQTSVVKQQLTELYPKLDQSQVSVDGLTVKIGGLTFALPSATDGLYNFANGLNQVAKVALGAAIAVAQFRQSAAQDGGYGNLDAKAQKQLKTLELQQQIAQAQAKGDKALANKLQAKLYASNSGFAEDTAEFKALAAEQEKLLGLQDKVTKGSKSKSPKSKTKEKSPEDYRNEWDKYYDDLVNNNASAWEKIQYAQDVAMRELEKHLSHGVVSQEEAEKARTLIAQQYAKQRSELAGQYAPEIAYQNKLKEQLQDIQQLEKGGALTTEQAARARQNLGAKYSPLIAAMEEYRQKLAEIDALEKARVLTTDQANIARADAEYEKWKGTADKSDPMNGIRQGWEEWARTAGDTMGQVSNITTQALDGMADQLTNFVMTGKADFRSLTVSILSDISKMIIKMMILNAIKSAFAGTSFGNFLGIKAESAYSGGLIGSGSVPVDTFSIGYATGGYTGNGGKYEPAGIVHKGEYVITKEATARLGRGFLDRLNYGGSSGYATGGMVGATPTSTTAAMGSQNNINITVNVDQNGNTQSNDTSATSEKEAKQLGKLIESKVLEVIVKQKRNGNLLA